MPLTLFHTVRTFSLFFAGAVCIANALADNGEAEIVAVGHTNGYVEGIGAISTLMHFYDRGTTIGSHYIRVVPKNDSVSSLSDVLVLYILSVSILA